MPLSTCTPYLEPVLTWLLPPVAAILSSIAALVVARTRSTYGDVRSTLEDHERLFSEVLQRPTRNVSPSGVRARKKRSTKGTTSTSRGDVVG